MTEGAFDGIRVVELAQWVFVPVAGALLADWGADVVRIDRPEGDPYRGLATQGIGTDTGGVNLSVALANRGKRSIALDVRSSRRPQGAAPVAGDRRRVPHQHAARRAAVASGSTPISCASATRRWCTPAATATACADPTPEWPATTRRPSSARGGLAHVLTPAERDYPIAQRGAMGDRNGGMALAFGIAERAAEAHPHRHGIGGRRVAARHRNVDAVVRHAVRDPGHASPARPRVGDRPSARSSARTARRTAATSSSSSWSPTATGRRSARSSADPTCGTTHGSSTTHARGEHRAECVAEIDELFASRTFEEWKELLRGLDAPWAPVQAVEELLTDPQVIANGYIGEVVDGRRRRPIGSRPCRCSSTSSRPHCGPPPSTASTPRAILLELGYDWDDIAEMQQANVIP